MADFDRESMMEMFTFEMNQLLEQLEQNIIQGENGYTVDQINEIFRIMHTIKGSAAMMLFNSIATAAHAIEDLFYFLREESPTNVDFSKTTDLVLEGMDFIKEELAKIEQGEKADGDNSTTNAKIEKFLHALKTGESEPVPEPVQAKAAKTPAAKTEPSVAGSYNYRAKIRFEDGCEMENVRAFTLINNLKPIAQDINHIPEDVISESSISPIREKGFVATFSSSKDFNEMYEHLYQTVYLSQLVLEQMGSDGEYEFKDAKSYRVTVRFDVDSVPENDMAYTLYSNIKNRIEFVDYLPEDLSAPGAEQAIRKDGFILDLKTAKNYDELIDIFSELMPLRNIAVEEKSEEKPTAAEQASSYEMPLLDYDSADTNDFAEIQLNETKTHPGTVTDTGNDAGLQSVKRVASQSVISVNVSKLDQLLKLMGEIVIAEAMVTQNPELEGLQLDDFYKQARQLKIILKDLQETVMSMRMVPMSITFYKMNRIVRDMCKQLNKEVTLEIIGEETEVDKNIIEHISDPIMHIIRNSVDHGIEKPEIRLAQGKSEKGTVLLEAKNSGSDILIIIKDDGAGLNREAIMNKARNNGLLMKPESEYTDKEVHQFIFMPGFSTNEVVTNFSGRGVGMDVVSKNLEVVRGTVLVDSTPGEGSTFTLKIPLTLAIIDGMVVKMGGAKYIIPIMQIKDTFRPKLKDVFYDPNGNEMITVRDNVYNVVRLYEVFGFPTEVTSLEDGIMVMVEEGDDFVCLFIDDLISEQQVVVKAIPKYIKQPKGISGCTLLGNGEISLIIDVAGFFDR